MRRRQRQLQHTMQDDHHLSSAAPRSVGPPVAVVQTHSPALRDHASPTGVFDNRRVITVTV